MAHLNTTADLEAFATAQCETLQLPALSVALWQDGQLHRVAGGIANISSGIEATPDTLFQIGSITKVMTTCLVMQLVDEGRVDLDKPVKSYLRDFQVADEESTHKVTVRQLINHTSGLAGDFFPNDEGHEGPLIARYVDRCSLLPQVHPAGALYSYSNSAFVIAGRLIEVIRGIPWARVIQEYLFSPLGMNHACADPKELIRFRAAMGHLRDADAPGGWALSNRTWLSLGMAPCGSTPMMSAADLITFARAHLMAGVTQSGSTWLSPASIDAMQVPQIAKPIVSQIYKGSAGLGWQLKTYAADGLRTVEHAGATQGFYSVLNLMPERNLAYAILFNGVCPKALQQLQQAMMQQLLGIDITEPALDQKTVSVPLDTTLQGTYESLDKRIIVQEKDGQLQAHLTYKIDPLPSQALSLHPITAECFAAYDLDNGQRQLNIAFVKQDAETLASYLYDGSRLNIRCS